MPSMPELAQTLAVWALPVLFAVTLHEVAHGWAARALGDSTAATTTGESSLGISA
jgi:hypothetical protein